MAVQLLMMGAAQGHRELVADLAAERSWLRELEMVGIRARERPQLAQQPIPQCQSAFDWDPLSASKRDPFDRRALLVALGSSEL
ncbi:hypothetical protein, partial [Bradyrhizobium sp. 146]|uniref:hypothetical protein n=1 Tax=Bradyrhizobium sp. 146 TaxID=2782622 RepID=UPI001FFBF1C8